MRMKRFKQRISPELPKINMSPSLFCGRRTDVLNILARGVIWFGKLNVGNVARLIR